MNVPACRLGTLTIRCIHRENSVPQPVPDNCELCHGTGERLHRHNIGGGQGPVPADIMLVGEAPGYYEDLTGRPFRPNAPAGRVLHRALEATIPFPCFITNAVRC